MNVNLSTVLRRTGAFLRRHHFVLLLALAFALSDWLLSLWNPMASSRRFYKNDYVKTIYHHGGVDHGRVFFGNSSVTGAYMEDRSKHPLVEFGLSYGKLTDLQAILQKPYYHVEDELVVGIDVHTMLDMLPTDPTYPWFKPWYVPYVYEYRDYFKDSGTELVKQVFKGIRDGKPSEMLNYQPRWIDKELYFGRQTDDWLRNKWNDYDKRFGAARVEKGDFDANLAALDYVISYSKDHQLPLKVVWMPWDRAYPLPPYMPALKAEVNRRLEAAGIPTLDLMLHYDPKYFSDLVHLNREDGAPLFTKEVDEWLDSFAKPSKS